MIENDASGKAIGYEPGKRIHLVRNPSWDKTWTSSRPTSTRSTTSRATTIRASPRAASSTGQSMINGDFAPLPENLKDALGRTARTSSCSIPSGGGRWIVDEHDDQAVRRRQRPQGRQRRLRPQRAAADARRQDRRRHRRRTILPPGHRRLRGGRRHRRAPASTSCPPTASRSPSSAAEYFKKAGYASGKYEGTEKILMVGSNAGVAAKTAEVAKENFEKHGLQGPRCAWCSTQTMYTQLLQRAVGEGRDLPERRLAEGLRRRPDDARPDLQRQEHPRAGQLQLVRSSTYPTINNAMDKAEVLRPRQRAGRPGPTIDKQVTAQAPADPVDLGQDSR